MIGSHDSYTYLSPKKKFFKLFSFLWRTQNKSIYEQIQLGVEYFDIRVKYENGIWRLCHGLVDFNSTFTSLEEILKEFKDYKVRLILEKGSEEEFIKEINSIKYKYECLSFSCIKKGWKVLVNKDPKMIDYSYVPFLSNLSFWQNIKRMKWFNTIKRWAKKSNPIITKELIDSETVYFMDYVE